jgi:hypothetical protein
MNNDESEDSFFGHLLLCWVDEDNNLITVNIGREELDEWWGRQRDYHGTWQAVKTCCCWKR